MALPTLFYNVCVCFIVKYACSIGVCRPCSCIHLSGKRLVVAAAESLQKCVLGLKAVGCISSSIAFQSGRIF